MVLLLLAALPGVVALVRLARRRDRAAVAACVLAVWILVAALFSGAPRLALGGVFGRESSALIAIGALGLWALGRELSEPGRRLLAPVLLSALAIECARGLLPDPAEHRHRRVRPDRGSGERAHHQPGVLRIADGRSGRSCRDPMAATPASADHARARRGLRVRRQPLRIARRPRCDRARARLRHGYEPDGSSVGSCRSPTSRARSSRSGSSPRSATAARAPPVAWRPAARVDGSTCGATDGRRSASAPCSDGVSGDSVPRSRNTCQRTSCATTPRATRVPIIFDAHNIVVELTVTLGIVGLVLAGVFAWHAGRRASRWARGVRRRRRRHLVPATGCACRRCRLR